MGPINCDRSHVRYVRIEHEAGGAYGNRFSNDRVIVLAVDDRLLVNALQRQAAVVLQKSIREGFGHTVSKAMWKRRAVIGGNVGGICHQNR
jgi:hypothetical protein